MIPSCKLCKSEKSYISIITISSCSMFLKLDNKERFAQNHSKPFAFCGSLQEKWPINTWMSYCTHINVLNVVTPNSSKSLLTTRDSVQVEWNNKKGITRLKTFRVSLGSLKHFRHNLLFFFVGLKLISGNVKENCSE